VLDDQTVLVEYAFARPDDSYLFAVSKGAVNLFKLPPRANIEKLQMDPARRNLIPSIAFSRRNRRHRRCRSEPCHGIATTCARNVAPFVAAANGFYKVVLIKTRAGNAREKRLL
jgi:hypothetical protein